jgi:uncharacterized protein
VVQQAAAAQAETEARRAWGIGQAEPIPFNHRWEHVCQVVRLALYLTEATGADREIVEAAAWLHDVRKEQPSHGVAGAAAAQEILVATDFPAGKIAAVTDAIRQHVGMFRPAGAPPLTPIEAAVLWDADKLSKLGVEAVMFNLCTTYAAYKPLDARRLEYLEFVGGLLSRTAVSMNTAHGRALAERRYREMLAVLDLWAQDARQGELDLEISPDYPGLPQE